MKRRRFYLLLIVLFLVTGGVQINAKKTTAATLQTDDLGSATNQELAMARAATAKYHDVATAIADGYVNVNDYEPGEGLHFVKFPLIDNTFSPDEPEVLLYVPVQNEDRLELVAVEYAIPLPLSVDPPEGFTGNADSWRRNEEIGVWECTAWVWLHNSNGMFAHTNPRVP